MPPAKPNSPARLSKGYYFHNSAPAGLGNVGAGQFLGRCPMLSHFAPLGLPKPRSGLPNQNRRAPHEVRGHAPNIGISSHRKINNGFPPGSLWPLTSCGALHSCLGDGVIVAKQSFALHPRFPSGRTKPKSPLLSRSGLFVAARGDGFSSPKIYRTYFAFFSA